MTLLQMRAKVRELLGNISATKYSDANINTAINNYKDTLVAKAILANDHWEYNGEVSTADIVAGQREYVLPTDLLALKRIEANLSENKAEDEWVNLSIVDMRSIKQSLTNQEDADDVVDAAYEIRVFDRSMFFNWPPEFDVTEGLKIYHQTEGTDLSADGDIPSFPQFSHIGLVYGACLDYSITKERNRNISNFKTLYDEKVSELETYYTKRLPTIKTKMTTKQRATK